MDREMAAQVLGHQLKGIMLHVDLFRAYLRHKNKRCAMRHYSHVLDETRIFLLTSKKIIEGMDENIEPVKEATIIIPEEEEKLLPTWQQWEHDTTAFYHQLMVDNPNCTWLKKLHDAAACEIIKAY